MGDWTGTVPTILAGHVTTADEWDAILDELTAVQAAWSTYSVNWTSSGTAPVLGNGTLVGEYVRVGKLVGFWIELVMGSTTTFGTGNSFFNAPVAARATGVQTVACEIVDFGTQERPAVAITTVSSTQLIPVSAAGQVSATVPQTFAVADRIRIAGFYQAV